MNTALRRLVGCAFSAAAAWAPCSVAAATEPGNSSAKVSASAQAVAPGDGSAELQKLKKAIGLARCQRDEECRTVPVGRMACGGPEGYLAWSMADSRPQRVQRLAAASAQARQAWHEHTGIASVCVVQPDPGAHCHHAAGAATDLRRMGRCELNSPAGKPDSR